MSYFARIYYPADNLGETAFAVPFQYIRQEYVTVYYKDSSAALYEDTLTEGVDYLWTSSSVISLSVPNPDDRDLLIRRQTPTETIAEQQPGVISSAKLNLNALQRQHVDEELYDEMAGVLASVSAFGTRLAAVEAVVGIGVAGLTVAAGEVLLAGAFVNIYLDGGARLRKADATDPLKWAHGFILSDGDIGEALPLNLTGLNSMVSPATLGEAYLSTTTPGGYSYSPPSATGQIIQPLGLAIPGNGILFTPQSRITL